MENGIINNQNKNQLYAILDIETTGGQYNEEGITEIAIYRFNGHKVTDQFISLVNPEKAIQPFVVNLTGINNKMLTTAPKFYEVAKRIVEITNDCILVAHNAQFDYRVLKNEFKQLGFDFERNTLCSVELSKKLIPGQASYSLGKLARSLGIPVSDRHRASGDAQATLKLFKLLLAKDKSKNILEESVKNSSNTLLTPKLLNIVDELPSSTGVYYIHRSDGRVIYIGKSKNIRKRVNQHFTGSSKKARALQKEVSAVTYEETGSELIALLKENEEIKLNQPHFNRSRKRKIFSYGLFEDMNPEGYITLHIEKIKPKGNPITTFTSIHEAKNTLYKLTEEFSLCNKLNGLSDAKSHCFNYTIKKCIGACIQKEDAEKYNERVIMAINKYSYPHKNMVLIDKGREIDERSAVLIEGGLFKGVGFYNLNFQLNNIHILQKVITPMDNNADAKHIIQSYLRKKKGVKIIQLITEK
ncbi:DNA polymerase-3 subunit epsilon [Zhouia amylolytica]|uniref:DNA polymerase-3 subunit epsilon n=1 Tax=Zhouia amylolytica TaxID=376730 RepID=A0A1I6QXJ0_9FLAO|nr:DNA polymerase-3 subunit epsilon [Zhouia amylolytica]